MCRWYIFQLLWGYTFRLLYTDNIKGVNIQFVPGEDLNNIFQDLEFNLVASRHLQAKAIKAQKNGDTIIDLNEEEGPETTEPEEDEII